MARRTGPIHPRLRDFLVQLGENMRRARLRRNLSTGIVAARAGMSRTTLLAVERGSPGVVIGAYANVLFVLGLEGDLGLLARDDELGRKLQDAGLPMRARASKRRRT